MSVIIIITPPPRVVERSIEPADGGVKVTEGGATLFTCGSREEALRWLQHTDCHPHTGSNPE